MYVCVCLSVMKKEREWWKEKRGLGRIEEERKEGPSIPATKKQKWDLGTGGEQGQGCV